MAFKQSQHPALWLCSVNRSAAGLHLLTSSGGFNYQLMPADDVISGH